MPTVIEEPIMPEPTVFDEVAGEENGTELQEMNTDPAALADQAAMVAENNGYGVLPPAREAAIAQEYIQAGEAFLENPDIAPEQRQQIEENVSAARQVYEHITAGEMVPEAVYGRAAFLDNFNGTISLPVTASSASTPVEQVMPEVQTDAVRIACTRIPSVRGAAVGLAKMLGSLTALGAIAGAIIHRKEIASFAKGLLDDTPNANDITPPHAVVPRELEQNIVGNIDLMNLPLGTVRIPVLTAQENPGLDISSLVLLDRQRNATASFDADGGPMSSAGKWTTYFEKDPDDAEVTTLAGVIFEPDNPENERPPLPVMYRARSITGVQTSVGIISFTYLAKGETGAAMAQAVNVQQNFGLVTVKLALRNGLETADFVFTNDDQAVELPFTLDGVGTWALGTTAGDVTFTPVDTLTASPPPLSYAIKDGDGKIGQPAKITVIFAEYQPPYGFTGKGPIARNVPITDFDLSESLVEVDGKAVSGLPINVLSSVGARAGQTIDPATLVLVTTLVSNAAEIPEITRKEPVKAQDGTLIGFRSITVKGQGEWRVREDGVLLFLSEEGFEGPTFAAYFRVADTDGNYSNSASVVLNRRLGDLEDLFAEVTKASNAEFWQMYQTSVLQGSGEHHASTVYAVTEYLEAMSYASFSPELKDRCRKARPREVPQEGVLVPWGYSNSPEQLYEIVSDYVNNLVANLDGDAKALWTDRVQRYVTLNLIKRCWRLYFSMLAAMEERDTMGGGG